MKNWNQEVIISKSSGSQLRASGQNYSHTHTHTPYFLYVTALCLFCSLNNLFSTWKDDIWILSEASHHRIHSFLLFVLFWILQAIICNSDDSWGKLQKSFYISALSKWLLELHQSLISKQQQFIDHPAPPSAEEKWTQRPGWGVLRVVRSKKEPGSSRRQLFTYQWRGWGRWWRVGRHGEPGWERPRSSRCWIRCPTRGSQWYHFHCRRKTGPCHCWAAPHTPAVKLEEKWWKQTQIS